MTLYIDNILLRSLLSPNEEEKKDSLLHHIYSFSEQKKQPFPQITFAWPSFLEYIGLGQLFERFPVLDENNKVYQLFLSTLASTKDKELLYHLYDQIFIECLNFVQSQPELKLDAILQAINQKKGLITKGPLFLPISKLEKAFLENPRATLHDLTLYLAWDFVCIYIAHIFEKPGSEGAYLENLEVLKACLLDSFQHIKKDHRTIPGYFRLLEALFAYMMREENLDKYSEEEWVALCSSGKALMDRRSSSDLYYIDLACHCPEKPTFFTVDSPERVLSRKTFVEFMTNLIKKEKENWHYPLNSFEVICLEEKEHSFSIKDQLFI